MGEKFVFDADVSLGEIVDKLFDQVEDEGDEVSAVCDVSEHNNAYELILTLRPVDRYDA